MKYTSNAGFSTPHSFFLDIFPNTQSVQNPRHIWRKLNTCTYKSKIGRSFEDVDILKSLLRQRQRGGQPTHAFNMSALYSNLDLGEPSHIPAPAIHIFNDDLISLPILPIFKLPMRECGTFQNCGVYALYVTRKPSLKKYHSSKESSNLAYQFESPKQSIYFPRSRTRQ